MVMESALGVAMNALCSGSPIVLGKEKLKKNRLDCQLLIRNQDHIKVMIDVYRWILTMHRIW